MKSLYHMLGEPLNSVALSGYDSHCHCFVSLDSSSQCSQATEVQTCFPTSGTGKLGKVCMASSVVLRKLNALFECILFISLIFQNAVGASHWATQGQSAGGEVREYCDWYKFLFCVVVVFSPFHSLSSNQQWNVRSHRKTTSWITFLFYQSANSSSSILPLSDKCSLLQNDYDDLEGEHERLTARHSKLVQDIDNKEAHWKDRLGWKLKPKKTGFSFER